MVSQIVLLVLYLQLSGGENKVSLIKLSEFVGRFVFEAFLANSRA